jgi:hypothetical protein
VTLFYANDKYGPVIPCRFHGRRIAVIHVDIGLGHGPTKGESVWVHLFSAKIDFFIFYCLFMYFNNIRILVWNFLLRNWVIMLLYLYAVHVFYLKKTFLIVFFYLSAREFIYIFWFGAFKILQHVTNVYNN